MKLKAIPLLLLISIFWLPEIAEAKEIDIQSGNVRVSKDQDGDIRINTGNSRLRVPANRSPTPVQFNSYQQYNSINGCRNRNLTRQEITSLRRTGNNVIRTHMSTNQC